MEFFILPFVAILGMIAIRFTKEKEIMRIEWDKISQFLGFCVMLSIVRLMQYDFMLNEGLMQRLPVLPPELIGHKWTFGLVFWEDMFFAVPLYYIWKYMSRKWLQVTLTVLLSVLFGLGHAYQGLFGVVLTAFLPYFVSYNYGKKYGFGTVMCCHIMYDVFTAYLIQMLPYLL